MTENLLAALDNHYAGVFKYEEVSFINKALRVIPLEQLKEAALKSSTLTFHENFMKELLRWFKEDFFSWVDCKPCSRIGCNGTTRNGGGLQPTVDEAGYGASRVEAHQCTLCGGVTRFPRYNDPSKLLETREGRCGEWANCFTGICRALGYDTRYVYDVTDHVWTEVFSPHLDRWVHCDPCENAWDRPLVYEQGWKKQLSYVIAFSRDEVVDVTMRYSIEHDAVRARRPDEARVRERITQLNKRFNHSPDKRQALRKRLVKEILQMSANNNLGNVGSYEGRQSGSAEWRQSRGEDGSCGSSPAPAIIQTKATSSFTLRYNIVTDLYHITTDGKDSPTVQGWPSLVFQARNLFKKVEYDWNKVYLARNSSDKATIEWRFHCAYPIKKAEVSVVSDVFHSGRIRWSYGGEDSELNLKDNYSSDEVDAALRNKDKIRIIAVLECGDGNNSWQHTQLFRADLPDESVTSFSISLSF